MTGVLVVVAVEQKTDSVLKLDLGHQIKPRLFFFPSLNFKRADLKKERGGKRGWGGGGL